MVNSQESDIEQLAMMLIYLVQPVSNYSTGIAPSPYLQSFAYPRELCAVLGDSAVDILAHASKSKEAVSIRPDIIGDVAKCISIIASVEPNVIKITVDRRKLSLSAMVGKLMQHKDTSEAIEPIREVASLWLLLLRCLGPLDVLADDMQVLAGAMLDTFAFVDEVSYVLVRLGVC